MFKYKLARNETPLIRTDNPTYPVFKSILQGMQKRFWIPETIDMLSDASNFQTKLTASQRDVYTANLGWQILADSAQYTNLEGMVRACDYHEVQLCLVQQIMEETVIHASSYQHIVSSMYADPTRMLDTITSNMATMKRADDVCYTDSPLNILALEGLSFTVSFLVTMALHVETGNAIPATATQIQKIAADESGHVVLFSNIVRIMMQEDPEYKALVEATVVDLFESIINTELEYFEYLNSIHQFERLNPPTVLALLRAKAAMLIKGLGIDVPAEHSTLLPWYNSLISINGTKVEQQAADSAAYVTDMVTDDWT